MADAFVPVAADPALSEYRVINMHRRGYMGSSEPTPPFTMAEQASDATAVLDALGIEHAHVVGHSYGGAIALQMASDASERVQSLVSIEPARIGGPAPTPASDVSTVRPARDPTELARANDLYANGDTASAVEIFFTFVFGDDWRGYFDAVPGGYEQTLADARTQFEIEGPAIVAWDYGPDELRRISVPTLFMAGEESFGFPPGAAEAAAELVPGSEALVVPETDHALITQAPGVVAAAIADFVNRHPM